MFCTGWMRATHYASNLHLINVAVICCPSDPVSTLCSVANISLAQVECNQDCIGVLKSRMSQGLLPEAEIVTDVKDFSAKGTNAVGLTAGFPCQASNL